MHCGLFKVRWNAETEQQSKLGDFSIGLALPTKSRAVRSMPFARLLL